MPTLLLLLFALWACTDLNEAPDLGPKATQDLPSLEDHPRAEREILFGGATLQDLSSLVDNASPEQGLLDQGAVQDLSAFEDQQSQDGGAPQDSMPFEDQQPQEEGVPPQDAFIPQDTLISPDVPPGCIPSCEGRGCGDPDGCGGACGPCPDEQVSMAPLPDLEPLGATETIERQGSTDDYLISPNGNVKIGIRREWGGTIIFFGLTDAGPGMNPSNVIDANDTGREVQVAFYDPLRVRQGCAHNASCQQAIGACPASISYLGWNPVQGGNRCNEGSGIEGLDLQPGLISLHTRPLHWNPDWQRADCQNDGCDSRETRRLRADVRYQQRLRFVQTEVVEMQMEVENLTDMDHPPTAQEFPTLYAAWGGHGLSNLRNILDSNGQRIEVDIPANDGFFMKNYESPEGWTMLQNDARDYGVGIYYEGKLRGFQAWQLEGVFNNLRSRFLFGLPPRGTVVARAYLLIGSEQTIHARAHLLDQSLPPFGVLDGPAQGEVASGRTIFRGWVLDNIGVERVELLVDGEFLADLGYGGDRPDVCRVYPGYNACPQVGYHGEVDLSELSSKTHLFEIRATDTHGNTRIVARRRIVVHP